ncbi:hypothetical protein DL765_002079 [Monosporascus sp. GIB2]|nr:hypothetical protein DL765_002079 [Monosporascus sp. GIB2]
MHYHGIILGLATAASAIDVYFHTTRSDCQGAEDSIGFRGIPTNWFLEVRGYEGGGCRSVKTLDTAFQTNFRCLGNGPYTGASYIFRGKKRGAEAGTKKCTLPDTLILDDGTKYSLVDMEDSQREELVAIASNGTAAADIPEAFKVFEKAE